MFNVGDIVKYRDRYGDVKIVAGDGHYALAIGQTLAYYHEDELTLVCKAENREDLKDGE